MARKKKKGHVVDFKKTKSNVGKKRASSTQLDTRFRAKSIVMPSQNLVGDKGEPTTHRNLTLGELLTQLQHYNNKVRREALSGMNELLERAYESMAGQVRVIVEGTVDAILDADPKVRQGLLAVYERLLQSPEARAAFVPVIDLFALYAKSALTHLDDAVRLDSLGFLRLWTQHFPESVRARGPELLQHYVFIATRKKSDTKGASYGNSGMQNPKTAAKEGTQLSLAINPKGAASHLAARVAIMNALAVILEVCLVQPTHPSIVSASDTPSALAERGNSVYSVDLHECAVWESAERAVVPHRALALAHATATHAARERLFPTSAAPTASASASVSVSASTTTGTGGGPTGGAGAGDASSDGKAGTATDSLDFALHLTDSLLPFLIECWVELDAATMFTLDRARCGSAILRVLVILTQTLSLLEVPGERRGRWWEWPENGPRIHKMAHDIATFFMAHFPLTVPARRSGVTDQHVEHCIMCNVLLAQLMTLFVGAAGRRHGDTALAGSPASPVAATGNGSHAGVAAMEVQVEDEGSDSDEDSDSSSESHDPSMMAMSLSSATHLMRVSSSQQRARDKAAAAAGVAGEEGANESEAWIGPICGFLLELLRATGGIHQRFAVTMLPLLPRLLCVASDDQARALMERFTALYEGLETGSATQLQCLVFMRRLVLPQLRAEADVFYSSRLDPAMVEGWLQGLPKLLCKLGTRHPTHTRFVLTMLTDAARCPPSRSQYNTPAMIQRMGGLLAPVMQAAAGGRVLRGPFVRWPGDCQAAFLHLLLRLDALSQPLVVAVAACTRRLATVQPTQTIAPHTDTLVRACAQHTAAPELVLSALMTLLLAGDPPATRKRKRTAAPGTPAWWSAHVARRREVAAAVSALARTLAVPDVATHTARLWEPLLAPDAPGVLPRAAVIMLWLDAAGATAPSVPALGSAVHGLIAHALSGPAAAAVAPLVRRALAVPGVYDTLGADQRLLWRQQQQLLA